QAGVNNYFQDFGSGRNRWGDYSATTVDPTDPQIFWTTQEWVSALNIWSTRASEIIIPASGEVRWANNSTGSFTTGTNWIGGATPGAGSHAIFSRPSTPGLYNVNMPLNGSVTNDRMSVRQGIVTFNMNGCTWTLTNAARAATPSITIAEFGGTPTVSITGNGSIISANTAISLLANGSINLSAATVNFNSGTWLNSANFALGGSDTVKGGAATFTMGSTTTLNVGGTLKVWNSATFSYNGASLSVGGNLDVTGGTFKENVNGSRLLQVGNVLVSAGGIVDLNDNDMKATSSSYSAITALISAARNAGAWDQSGITSTAAKNNPNGITTLGTLVGQDYLDNSPNGPLFDGQPVAATDVVVKYTYYGDSNLDGDITLDDYAFIDGGFLLSLTGWMNGDYDYSGGVATLDDYSLIDGAFLLKSGVLRHAITWLENGGIGEIDTSIPALGKVVDHFDQFGQDYAYALFAAVPEPTGAGVALLGAAGLLRRRRSA
ncbi:MAG: hypothetical protein ACREJC_00140, partial [Tepidisphaeraceae bacterium]